MLSSLFVAAMAVTFAAAAPSSYPGALVSRQRGPPGGGDDCSLEGITQPASTLAAPAAGLSLVLVARGRGTQNFTCGADKAVAPAPNGAMATLFDASCTVSKSGPPDRERPIGMHFFADKTTPEFDINDLGITKAKKTANVDAPNPAADAQWLLLDAQAEGTTSNVKQIYRLNTKGGLAPPNCADRAEGDEVTVGYETEYWIYAAA